MREQGANFIRKERGRWPWYCAIANQKKNMLIPRYSERLIDASQPNWGSLFDGYPVAWAWWQPNSLKLKDVGAFVFVLPWRVESVHGRRPNSKRIFILASPSWRSVKKEKRERKKREIERGNWIINLCGFGQRTPWVRYGRLGLKRVHLKTGALSSWNNGRQPTRWASFSFPTWNMSFTDLSSFFSIWNPKWHD